MIHGNSKDPVLVKKIYLKIWTLRSEVEQVVKNLENCEDQAVIDAVKKEYEFKGPLKAEAGLTLIDGGARGEAAPEGEASEEAEAAPEVESEDQQEVAASENEEANNPEEEASQVKAKIIQRGSENLDPANIHHGVCVLGEISMDSLNLFTSRKFMEGQSIVIEFQVPKKFIVNAEVLYCRQFNDRSRIISENKLQCRVCARFTFLKEGERTLLRQFINSIEPEIPEVVEVPKAAQSDDDEFDDLAGLDF